MYRLQGTIKKVETTPKIFGVIDGDDGLQYFFMPSLMRGKSEFFRCRVGLRVEFYSLLTPQGLRGSDITVLWLSLDDRSAHDGESASSKG